MDDPVRALAGALPAYEIGGELGRGAFGVVVAGRHRQLGREVAIKQLAPGLVANQTVRTRFLSEAQVLASLAHPHIVPIYDYVEHDETCALVMERLVGGTVWHHFVNEGYDQRTACAIALVTCSGLDSAHQHGVLHRDMKPENILIGDQNILKVADFGIARLFGEDNALATPDGELLGTPAYMAPEQAAGVDLGPPTDVFAAGVLLYELLSGRLPYRDDGGAMAIVLRHVNEDAIPISTVNPNVPVRIADVVMRALARAPGDRFQSALEFGVAIGEGAAATWGPGWTEGLRVSLRDPGPILESTRKGTAPAESATDAGVVRPMVDLHEAGGAGDGLVLSDLMPLRRTPVDMPDFPRVLAWASGILAALAIVFGLLGVGSSTPRPALGAGTVSIAGHDPATGRVPLNLEDPTSIVVHNAPGRTGPPTSARLTLSLGGVPMVHATSLPFVFRSGAWRTTADASAGRYIVGGKLTANLALTGPNGTVNDGFGVQAARTPFATFIGVVAIVLLLLCAAYAESLLRTLRSGRRRNHRASVVGLGVVGAFGGVAAALWGWLLNVDSPTIASLILPAAIGLVAGLLAGLAGVQIGARARARRHANRLVLVARRRATLDSQHLAEPRVTT
jgi:hypothetical protein